MKISFEDFKSSIENAIQKYNAEGHRVCNGLYTLELSVVFRTNRDGEHIAVLYRRWKESGEKFTRPHRYYAIQHTYRNFDPECKTFSVWYRGETIYTTNKVAAIFKKYFNY